jgi:hypothetical protein
MWGVPYKPRQRYNKQDWAVFWDFKDGEFRKFRDAIPCLLDHLRRMVERFHGPAADFTVGSLEPLGEWLIDLARADFDDGAEWMAPWQGWEVYLRSRDYLVREKYPNRLMSLPLLRMQESLAAYYGEVVIRQVPGARWVCWRGMHNDDARNGSIEVDVGNPGWPTTAQYALLCLRRSYTAFFDESRPDYEEPKPRAMLTSFDRHMTKRREFLERFGEPVWQVASCGPAADTGRTYRKRASFAWLDAVKEGSGLPTVFRGPAPPPDPDVG